MTSSSDPEQPPPLDYQKKTPAADSGGCLVLSILFTVPTAMCFLITVAALVSGYQWGFLVLLHLGLIGMVLLAIMAKKKLGISAALAIVLTTICIFFMLLGLCASL